MIQRSLFPALLVVIAVWAVNEPTLDYGFVYDDHAVIEERKPVWDMSWREFLATRTLGVGRHVTLVSLDLDRREPLSSRPFHVTNTTLAAMNSLLVLAVARSVGLTPAAALVTALVFAVQPTHVDAVVSIVGRSELLAALGVLAALWLHVNGYFGRFALAGLGGASFFLALASKESAACLPLLLILTEIFGVGRTRDAKCPRAWPLPYVVAFGLWLALVWGNFATTDPIPTVDNPLAAAGALERILRAGELLWKYVAWTLWPFGLKPDRGYAEVGARIVAGPAAWIAWGAVVASALALRRRRPLLGLALLWLPASFAVTGNVAIPIGTLMAERLLYLPSLGPCLLAGMVFERLRANSARSVRAFAVIAAGAAVLLLAFAYDERARVWSSDDHYHEQAAALSPRSAKAHYNLALSFARRGRYEEAEQSFARALAIAPDLGAAAYYRAEALTRLGRAEEAAAVYTSYLETAPDDVNALRAAAECEARLGHFDNALALLRHAVEIAPEREELRTELADLETRARAAQSLKASSSTGSR
jgi:tetratricopeptide (TPR) repeat protein